MRTTNYRNPSDITDGPFQYAHKTSDPFFVWLGERPEQFEHFNNFMSGYRQGKRSWMDPGFYPVEDRLAIKSTDENPVLLVDVGGGLGHDLEEFTAKYPSMVGSLVLQDQKDVISQINAASPSIELTAHDFFTPQPVKGIDYLGNL